MDLLSSVVFSKLTSQKNSFWITIRESKGFDPDQDRCSVGPDLGPNCLQKGYQQMTKVSASKERAKLK